MNIALIYVDQDLEAFGVRNISSALKAAGHETKLILMKTKDAVYSQQVLDAAKGLVADSDVIGMSCFSRASQKAIQVMEHMRPLGKVTVWGGIHATLNAEQCARHADLVCRGEGEEFMIDLAGRLGQGDGWRDIPNGVYADKGRLVVNEPRPLLDTLDTLPMMDFSRDNEWHLSGEEFVRVTGVCEDTAPIAFNGTRGCAFRCTYCSNSKLKQLVHANGHYVRKLSIEKLVEQAQKLRERFPNAKCFDFFDEDFCARPVADIEKFSRLYSERVGIPFECMVSPVQVNEEKIDWLVKAGLWRINMGVESGSERTKREVYDRHMSNDAVMRAAKVINKYPHVVPYYFFIIGNPYETRDDLLSTARFLGSLPQPFYLRTYNLVFVPGTLLYETAVKDGIIQGSKDSGFELDFLGGFNYKKHPWKKSNLYLNGLLYLMAGKISRGRLGLVPRRLLDFLLRPDVVEFNEKHTLGIRGLIATKLCLWKLRGLAARVVKKALKDPRAIYRVGK
ncbi:MAG: radical SAM protein [Phycisphaerales bacterium]